MRRALLALLVAAPVLAVTAAYMRWLPWLGGDERERLEREGCRGGELALVNYRIGRWSLGTR